MYSFRIIVEALVNILPKPEGDDDDDRDDEDEGKPSKETPHQMAKSFKRASTSLINCCEKCIGNKSLISELEKEKLKKIKKELEEKLKALIRLID